MYWMIVKAKRDGSNQRKILSATECQQPKENFCHKGMAINKRKCKHNGMTRRNKKHNGKAITKK
jgi:hypothetical protein